MDALQRLNYLLWLKDRGQTYVVPLDAFARPADEVGTPEFAYRAGPTETSQAPMEVATTTAAGDGPGGHEVLTESTAQAATPMPANKQTPAASNAQALAQSNNTEVSAFPQFKVIFYAKDRLSSDQREMVTRIAGALSLGPADFVITSGSEAAALIAAQEHCSIVVMGEHSMASVPGKVGQSVLIISHPEAMIREPHLKVATWNILQKLKAAL